MSRRCLICDVAWALGISEKQFYLNFDREERAQLMATYQSKMNREAVMSSHPVRE